MFYSNRGNFFQIKMVFFGTIELILKENFFSCFVGKYIFFSFNNNNKTYFLSHLCVKIIR